MKLLSKIISGIGLVTLVIMGIAALFLTGYALQLSGWGWVAIVAIFGLVGYCLYDILRDEKTK